MLKREIVAVLERSPLVVSSARREGSNGLRNAGEVADAILSLIEPIIQEYNAAQSGWDFAQQQLECAKTREARLRKALERMANYAVEPYATEAQQALNESE